MNYLNKAIHVYFVPSCGQYRGKWCHLHFTWKNKITQDQRCLSDFINLPNMKAERQKTKQSIVSQNYDLTLAADYGILKNKTKNFSLIFTCLSNIKSYKNCERTFLIDSVCWSSTVKLSMKLEREVTDLHGTVCPAVLVCEPVSQSREGSQLYKSTKISQYTYHSNSTSCILLGSPRQA